MLFAPLLFYSMAWITGRLIISICSVKTKLNEGFIIFIGIGVVLAITSNLTFLGVLFNSNIIHLVLAIILMIALYNYKVVFIDINWKELAAILLIVVVVLLHYLLPNIIAGGAPIALLEAGDFNQYISIGAWLQSHAITTPSNYYSVNSEWNVVNFNVYDFQTHYIRLGSSLLFSFFSELFSTKVTQIYSIFVALNLSILSLGVFVFSSSLLNLVKDEQNGEISIFIPLLVAMLFGISPVVTWAGLAAFIPQILGLSFSLALLSSFFVEVNVLPIIKKISFYNILNRDFAVIWHAIILFSIWATYPEVFPLVFVIAGGWILISALDLLKYEIFLIKFKAKSLFIYTLLLLSFAILVSPFNFLYSLNGLVEMMKGAPHGGMMVATPFNLLAVMFGLSTMPLEEQILIKIPNTYLILPLITMGFIGLFYFLKQKLSRNIVISFVQGGVIIYAYIFLHYGILRQGILNQISHNEVSIIVNWNYFKAAQFLSPFVFVIAYTGLFVFISNSGKVVKTLLLLLVFSTFTLVIVTNDQRYFKEAQVINTKSGVVSALNKLPSGRLLVSLNKSSRYERYALYSDLVGKPFISTRDAQYPCVKVNTRISELESLFIKTGRLPTRKKLNGRCNSNFFDEPISYVITESSDISNPTKVLYKDENYTIVDMRNSTFSFSTKDVDFPIYYFISNPNLVHNNGALVLHNLLGHQAEIDYEGNHYVIKESNNPYELVDLQEIRINHGISQIYVDSKSKLLNISIVNAPYNPLLLPYKDLIPLILKNTGDSNNVSVVATTAGFDLALSKPGDSRILLDLNLEPGEYLFKISVSRVEITKNSNQGFGAYFGKDNDFDTSVELSMKPIFYRFIQDDIKARSQFSLGIGGWGKASGHIEFSEFYLYKINNNRSDISGNE